MNLQYASSTIVLLYFCLNTDQFTRLEFDYQQLIIYYVYINWDRLS